MLKILFTFAAISVMFSSSICSDKNLLKEGVSFDCYNNGYKIEMSEEDVLKIDEIFCNALKDCHILPAYGVAIHNDISEAVYNGVWIDFKFDKTLNINELNFDELLIPLTKDMHGFNVIRGNNGKFEGRNFYVDIQNTLDDLYNYIVSLPISEEQINNLQQTNYLEPNIRIKEVNVECEDCRTVITKEEMLHAAILPSVNKDKEKNTVIDQGMTMVTKYKNKGRPFEDKIQK